MYQLNSKIAYFLTYVILFCCEELTLEGCPDKSDTTYRYSEFIIAKLIESFRALKFPRHYLLVLLVKVGWREGKTLGSAEGKAMGCVDRICSR